MTASNWEQLDTEQLRNFVEKGIPCIERMGLKVREMAPRRASLLAPLKGNENHIGTMYAGIQFTLAEIPGGILFLTTFDVSKYIPIVKNLNISFIRPATTDITIDLELSQEEVDRVNAELEEKGKSDFILNGELKDTQGTVVAKTAATYQIRKM